jgi:hypothetical protein
MPTVADAAGGLFTAQGILEWTKTITIVKKAKYYEIVDYDQVTQGALDDR